MATSPMQEGAELTKQKGGWNHFRPETGTVFLGGRCKCWAIYNPDLQLEAHPKKTQCEGARYTQVQPGRILPEPPPQDFVK